MARRVTNPHGHEMGWEHELGDLNPEAQEKAWTTCEQAYHDSGSLIFLVL